MTKHGIPNICQGSGEWPSCGGANGSIRFVPEINHGANNGLVLALELLKPIKQECPKITFADLFQLASAVGIEVGEDYCPSPSSSSSSSLLLFGFVYIYTGELDDYDDR